MFCWNCGKENAEGATYCFSCGKKLDPADMEVPVKNFNGAGWPGGDAVYSQMFEPDNQYAEGFGEQESSGYSPAPKKRINGVWIAVIVAAVIVIIILLMLIAGAGKSDAGKTPDDAVYETSVIEEEEIADDVEASDTEGAANEDASDTNSGADTQETHISGSETGYKLTFSVDQKESFDIVVSYENNSDKNIQFGWTTPSTVVLTTSAGTYTEELPYITMSNIVYAGESGEINVYFADAEGTIESIKICGVIFLKDNNLPEDSAGVDYKIEIDCTE